VSEKIGQALARAGQPVKRGTMAHDHHLVMLLTESAVHQRDAAAIRQHASHLQALAERDGHKLYQGVAQRAWGVAHTLAGEHAQAQARLESALALFRDLETGWQAGRTLALLAELMLARGDTAAARQAYQQALVTFEALGATPDAARTQAALAALG
jgi:tetratricopeptide (TPR) repeat protein